MQLAIPDSIDPVALLGPADSNLKTLERLEPSVDILARDRGVRIRGPREHVDAVVKTFGQLKKLVAAGQHVNAGTVEQVHSMDHAEPSRVLTEDVLSSRGRMVRPKTLGQHEYVKAIRRHTITFGIGPAGTGKTYLAMAMAVSALDRGDVKRIILTRPAVEAGERLGFLPGTLNEKIDPYVRPLYDALHDMVEPGRIKGLLEAGVIEVAPLAYMRGRTLNDAFIILDEAQNTTPEQMKMFLTRLGFQSRMVVTGDVSQIDLPGSAASGLKVVSRILKDVDDVCFFTLSSKDVVRHPLVSKIVDAYDAETA